MNDFDENCLKRTISLKVLKMNDFGCIVLKMNDFG
ncbi:hypothetical protein T03_607 [Trichinella britovi]|uniref:Uncharacterized protein n=1 Tax=Trichinella britovi TaxID=45882 RepID=A0A0V0YQU7_TRIBR|nr:hypothetical protein T03_607 [Trichinella britovi]